MDNNSSGKLQVIVLANNSQVPVVGANVTITYSGEPDSTVENLVTNEIGRTEIIEVPAPSVEYTLEPSVIQPYAQYSILVTAEGFEPVEVSDVAVLADVTAIQQIRMRSVQADDIGDVFVVMPHTLYYEYPPKIAEDEIKPIGEEGEIVLDRVVIPEFIIVHDGVPTDTTAKNYTVTYRDYIKNVASSEIYATWPEATIFANILSIMSFTLNRVFTEWYRNKGYDFTITSSTAFDHKWMPGRNIYDTIDRAVDTLFNNYLSRPGVLQPILTQYCDGERVTCPNWLSQWGSKQLGDQGYSTIEILRNYYGSNIFINTADQVAGVPQSWGGTNLTIGSRGNNVRQMQQQLNVISNTYSLIPKLTEDGIFGERTADAVRIFQETFNLPVTGIVDRATWYKISHIYVGVSRIAEL